MDIRLPQLAEGVESGMVVGLLVSEGDRIEAGQDLLEIETQKAVGTVPSPQAGTVTKLHVKLGDEIAVGQVLATLSGDKKSSAPARKQGELTKPPARNTDAAQQVVESRKATPETRKGAVPLPPKGIPIAASPSVRKLAAELGLDLREVSGSARGGRIVMKDVHAYVQRLQQLAAKPATGGPRARRGLTESVDFSRWGPITRQKVSSLRRKISEHVSESWASVPHVTQFDEADVTSVMELREKYAARYEEKGAKLTLTGFALRVVAGALPRHPIFNSSLDDAKGEIVLKEYYHIGLAVDTEAGLIVPVLKDVDKKSLFQICMELKLLAESARARKIALEELQGGTFTVSNQGGIGGAHFTPIINTPEVAILGLGQGRYRPFVEGKIVSTRTMLPLALSYDHRVIDGADAARFIKDLVAGFERFKESDVKL